MHKKSISMKTLLGIMAIDIVRDWTDCTNKKLYVPLEVQQKVIASLLPTMCAGKTKDEFYSKHNFINNEPLFMNMWNFFLMYVEYEESTNEMEHKSIRIKGFDTFLELKNFVENVFSQIDMFRVYINSLDEYKNVDYKYSVNQESGRITNFSIPSLAEFFPVDIIKGGKYEKITIPYFAGIIPSLSIYKDYVVFVYSDYFIECEPFEVQGKIAYEGQILSYTINFDGHCGYGDFGDM